MILIWFNPNNQNFYTRYYKSYINYHYYVGYRNSYNHVVVQILIITDNKIFNCYDYYDYYSRKRKMTSNSLHHRLLNFLKKI